MLLLIYGLDLLCRPLVWLCRRVSTWTRRWTARAEQIPTLHVNDLRWAGPDTLDPVDNDFYKDEIRARSAATRLPNHVVVRLEGQYARLTRHGNRLAPISRHGQVVEYSDVVSAGSQSIRRVLEEHDSHRVCLCRNQPCENQGDFIRARAYAGVDPDALLKIAGETSSPLCLCC